MKNDIVINFLNKYNSFTKVIATANKKKFDSIDSIYTVNSAIKSLIEIIEQNRIDEIDLDIINNLIHFAEEYLKIIKISSYKEKITSELKNNLQKVRILLEKRAKSLQR